MKYGSESICVYMGTGREAVRYGFTLSSKVLRTPNNCYAQSGWSCMGPRQTAMTMMLGSAYIELDYNGGSIEAWDDPDWTLPDYVFCLGKEPLKSNPDGLWGHALIELMKRGSKLIMVDPRVNWLASRAPTRCSNSSPAPTPRLPGHLERAHQRGPHRPRLRREVVLRLRRELKERVQEYTRVRGEGISCLTEERCVTAARKLGYDGAPLELLMGRCR